MTTKKQDENPAVVSAEEQFEAKRKDLEEQHERKLEDLDFRRGVHEAAGSSRVDLKH